MNEGKLTRVTLVDDDGLVTERRDLTGVRLSVQDDGRTLKVFITKRDGQK